MKIDKFVSIANVIQPTWAIYCAETEEECVAEKIHYVGVHEDGQAYFLSVDEIGLFDTCESATNHCAYQFEHLKKDWAKKAVEIYNNRKKSDEDFKKSKIQNHTAFINVGL